MDKNTKDLLAGSSLFLIIIIVMIAAAWLFNPPGLLFSENFENSERNLQYMPCPAFTIEEGRLRVTVSEPHSGCAVRLPNEYEDFTLTSSVYPVEDVHDGSINVLFEQNENGGYEIQYRPNEQQINMVETAKSDNNEEMVVKFMSGWIQAPGIPLNNAENKIKLTVTRHGFSFWFNDLLIFDFYSSTPLLHDMGIIKIGAGANEFGGIAFEFDNVEIHEEKLYSEWLHDYQAMQYFIKSEAKSQ